MIVFVSHFHTVINIKNKVLHSLGWIHFKGYYCTLLLDVLFMPVVEPYFDFCI